MPPQPTNASLILSKIASLSGEVRPGIRALHVEAEEGNRCADPKASSKPMPRERRVSPRTRLARWLGLFVAAVNG